MPDAVPPAEHAAWLVKSRGMVAKIKEEYFQETGLPRVGLFAAMKQKGRDVGQLGRYESVK